MRIYDMKCTHPLCGRVFDWHTRVGVYEQSKADDFRDVPCFFCGRFGARRAYTSAVPDLTPKGKWGRTASPELKGKTYYGKEERDRQLTDAGTVVHDDGEDRGTFGTSRVTASKRDEARDAIVSALESHGDMRLKQIIAETGLSDRAVHDVIYKDPGRITKVGWGTYGLTGVVAAS